MATNADKSTADVPLAKGGLFGGPFDSTGLDSNVRDSATLRNLTGRGGHHPRHAGR